MHLTVWKMCSWFPRCFTAVIVNMNRWGPDPQQVLWIGLQVLDSR